VNQWAKVLAALLALVLIGVSCAPAGEDRVLPDSNLELLDGGDYPLRQTGQARALNLWGTWCAPCRAELPAFEHVASRVKGVEIIGINTGDKADAARNLVDELDLSFRQIFDPNATVQSSLRITGMPATIFVDEQGEIVQIHSGELTASELEKLLTDLLGASFDG